MELVDVSALGNNQALVIANSLSDLANSKGDSIRPALAEARKVLADGEFTDFKKAVNAELKRIKAERDKVFSGLSALIETKAGELKAFEDAERKDRYDKIIKEYPHGKQMLEANPSLVNRATTKKALDDAEAYFANFVAEPVTPEKIMHLVNDYELALKTLYENKDAKVMLTTTAKGWNIEIERRDS
jgi:hypothetical protein